MKRILLGLMFLSLNLTAKETNVFLQRDFWKQNPSVEKVKELMAKGHDIAAMTKHQFDGMVWGLLENTSVETLKFVLKQKGNGSKKITHDGRNYLFWAAYKANLPMIKHLISKGSDVALIDSHGYNILNFMAVAGVKDIPVYDYLLTKGAKFATHPKNGTTATMMIASRVESFTMFDYFKKHSYNLTDKDLEGNSVFNYAAQGGKIDFLKQLIAKKVFPTENTKGENAFFFAARGLRKYNNPLAVYTYLKGLGIKANLTAKDNSNWLHILANTKADKNIWEFAMNEGLSITQQDNRGVSPLMTLIKRNNTELFLSLIDNQKVSQQVDEKGNCLFHYATSLEKPNQILTVLKKHSLNLEHKNKAGFTPLQKLVSETKDVEKIKEWINFGANKNVKTEFGETIYDLAKANQQINKSDLSFLKS